MLRKKNGYRYSARKNKGKSVFLILGGIVLAAAVFVVLFWMGQVSGFFSSLNNRRDSKQEIESYFKQKNYDAVLQWSEKQLKEDPYDPFSLIMKGFASFYKGVSVSSLEQRYQYMNDAVFSLRKASHKNTSPFTPQLNYVLGKAYLQKGKFYADLAIKYLRKSLDQGYLADDTYEYLGLALSKFNQFEESVYFLEKAADIHYSDYLVLNIGRLYYQLKDYKKAKEQFHRVIKADNSKEAVIEGRHFLGEILIEQKNYEEAMQQYIKIIELDEDNADALFFIGEIYYNQGNIAQARAYWRKTLRVAPAHRGAKERYYN